MSAGLSEQNCQSYSTTTSSDNYFIFALPAPTWVEYIHAVGEPEENEGAQNGSRTAVYTDDDDCYNGISNKYFNGAKLHVSTSISESDWVECTISANLIDYGTLASNPAAAFSNAVSSQCPESPG